MSFHSLVNFFLFYQTYITEFCQAVVKIFSEYSPSQCKIPKLHVLRYHVIPSIQLYGSMNGMSTETYETLHKTNVKNPYRMTNKRNYVPQMLNTVCYIILFISLVGMDRSGLVQSRSKKTGLLVRTGPDRSISWSQDRSISQFKTGP